MRIYLAGGDRKAYRELLTREGVQWVALTYARWLGKPGALRREVDAGRKVGTRYLLLGALPRGVEIEPDRYAKLYNRFCGYWGHLFEAVEGLGEKTPIQTDHGPVTVIPVWEPGQDWKETLAQSTSKYVGVRGETPRLPVMLAQARKRGIRVHGFHTSKIHSGSGLRFDSVDSSSWVYSSEAHHTLYVFRDGRFHILTDQDSRKLDLGRHGRYLRKCGADIEGLRKGNRASLVQAAVIAWRDLSAHMEGAKKGNLVKRPKRKMDIPQKGDLTKRKVEGWIIPIRKADIERALQIRAGIRGLQPKIGDTVGTELDHDDSNPPHLQSQLSEPRLGTPSTVSPSGNESMTALPTASLVMTGGNKQKLAKVAFKHALCQLPGLTCDACAMQVGCPRFDESAECAYQATFDGLSIAETAENDISGAEVIADVNRMRALRAVTLENRVNGGIPSKETTALLHKSFQEHMSLVEARSGGKAKLTVQASGGGILSRIFGSLPQDTLDTNPETIEAQIVPPKE